MLVLIKNTPWEEDVLKEVSHGAQGEEEVGVEERLKPPFNGMTEARFCQIKKAPRCGVSEGAMRLGSLLVQAGRFPRTGHLGSGGFLELLLIL